MQWKFSVPIVAFALGCGSQPSQLPSAIRSPNPVRVDAPGVPTGVALRSIPGQNRAEFRAEPRAVLEAVANAYASLEIEATLLDSRRRIFGVQGYDPPRTIADRSVTAFLDCGYGIEGPNVLYYDVTVDILTMVYEGESGGSVIESVITGWAEKRSVRADPVRCTSTGRLESTIAERVGLQVRD